MFKCTLNNYALSQLSDLNMQVNVSFIWKFTLLRLRISNLWTILLVNSLSFILFNIANLTEIPEDFSSKRNDEEQQRSIACTESMLILNI